MPTSKDLSYVARKEKRDLAVIDRIKAINADFKLLGVLCKLQIKGKNGLVIRYRDPFGKQKDISPKGVDRSPDGIHKGEELCKIISQALRLGNYTDEWLETEIYKTLQKEVPVNAGTVRDEFPERWLKHRSGDKESTDRQKRHTLLNYTNKLAKLYRDAKIADTMLFDGRLISRLLSLEPEGSNARNGTRQTLSVVCSIFGIEYNFKGIGKKPKPKERKIPSDDEILTMYGSFDLIDPGKDPKKIAAKEFYQWVFGILATYGLRPQETFAIDWNNSFKPNTKYWLFLKGSLVEGIKTGDRVIPPLHPQWVDLFDLANMPEASTSTNDVSLMANKINRYFKAHNIGCVPYDLRHAYVIRGDKLGVSAVKMARACGHDVATHVRIYQRYISVADQIESFDK
jgi:integrase